MDDLVIRGGEVLDCHGWRCRGTGRADCCHGNAYADTARRTMEARGLVAAPGFIDIKTHSDFTLPYAPGAESKVLQGSELGGGVTPVFRKNMTGRFPTGTH